MNRQEMFKEIIQSNTPVIQIQFPGRSLYVHPHIIYRVCKIPDIIDESQCSYDLLYSLICHLYMHESGTPFKVQFKDLYAFISMRRYLSLTVPVKIIDFPEIKIWNHTEYTGDDVKSLINTLVGVPLITTCTFHLDERDAWITYYDMFNDDIYPKHSTIMFNGVDVLKKAYKDGFTSIVKDLLHSYFNL
jgi:hypothetical protein